jgi:hypothetical protein
MMHARKIVTAFCAVVSFAAAGCSDKAANIPPANPSAVNTAPAAPAAPASSPSQQAGVPLTAAKNLTAADVDKIKWLEGTYKGTAGDKQFFNRYRFNGTTLNVNSFDDPEMTKQRESAVYELKDGMFANPSGDHRFAAVEMTDSLIQFVSVTDGPSLSYKLEKQADGSVKATLGYNDASGRPLQTTYILERHDNK